MDPNNMPDVKFDNIEQIKQHQFVGCYGFDYKAFQAIDQFVLNTENSLADRAEALRQMSDRGMGCGREENQTDKEIVETYIEYADLDNPNNYDDYRE